MQRLSIVIPNYNYRHFVGAAIESALAVDWLNVEIIVVDDGSTDDSRSIIAAYADRVRVIEQANAGAREACNVGFAASSGDVVIFLDSDDILAPTIAREIAAVWRSGISKVQVQMWRIDRDGVALGSVFPDFTTTPSPEQIRRWMRTTTAYPTPPGSGNAYAREFLDKLFPLDDRCGQFSDSACLAVAPYLGDVITIPKPLVGYRIHGNNDSDLLADPAARLPIQITRAWERHLYSLDIAGESGALRPLAPLFLSRHLLQMRVAERRINGGRPPIPGDGKARMFRDSFAVLVAPGPEPVAHRLAVSAWCLATLVAPPPLARRLITARFSRGRSAA